MSMEKGEKHAVVRNRRSRAGETLAETLVAMLIIGLSSVLFMTMTGASGRIFQSARNKYRAVYEDVAVAEEKKDPPLDDIGKITVKGVGSVSVDVNWYGNKDYVLSYKVK